MEPREIEDNFKEVMQEDNYREFVFGEYHPSEVTGCPLKVVLNKMTEHETILNCYLFQGTAVHYYLQETGLLDEILHESGYHTLDTNYEVSNRKVLGDGVSIVGTTDVLCESEDARTIFDIKYSSATPGRDKGRLTKYFSQTNTYAYMFDADEYGLMIVDSKERDNLPEDGITVLSGEPNDENWELVKSKARSIHSALEDAGYQDGVVWPMPELEEKDIGFWEDVIEPIDRGQVPAYGGECKWCPHADYCPEKNGKFSGGLSSFKGGN